MSCYVFFFKQKTAYEMRISDWSSDVYSSDLGFGRDASPASGLRSGMRKGWPRRAPAGGIIQRCGNHGAITTGRCVATPHPVSDQPSPAASMRAGLPATVAPAGTSRVTTLPARSEEHTSELQSLMRTSYAVFCLTQK